MPLYTIGNNTLTAVPTTSFTAARLRERDDLQRLLRESISIVAPETLVIAEEFGSWDASYRRIDLLGIDRNANLVVIELKRDETGAHMELQALRYAAMVARMTFDQAVSALHDYRSRLTPTDPATQLVLSGNGGLAHEDARSTLLRFLGWEEPDESSFAKDVRIVLVSADFSRELTTSVMWLNERDLDIRCVQIQPYQLGDQLLVQVEQVIPLREASEYQIQVREKARRERVGTSQGADWTQYDLTIGETRFTNLPKRRLIYHAARHVIEALAKTPEELGEVVQHGRLWAWLDGHHDSDSFCNGIAKLAREQGLRIDPGRFLTADDELLHVGGKTYAFTKGWGTNTLPAMRALCDAFPEAGIQYQPSSEH